MTGQFDIGDVVKAGQEFEGTVVKVDGAAVQVEDRDGIIRQYHENDLKETC